MQEMIVEKLRHLTEMSLPEIRFRTAQQIRLTREQWQIALKGGSSDDKAGWYRRWNWGEVIDPYLQAAIKAGNAHHAATLLPGYFMKRSIPAFYWDFSERDRIVAELQSGFASDAKVIRADAEAICDHRFRIFAHADVSCGPRIPWRRDLVHGVESGLDHYARIPCLDFEAVGDSKNVWEINRHQHLIVLCLAYLFTGEDRFAEECLRQWEHWLLENPYLRGINWASSLEVAFRSWSWLWVLYLLLGSRALTGERLGQLTLGFSRNAEFVAKNLSTYFAPNTHLIGEGFSLFVVGLLLPELERAAIWREQGRQILIDEMARQVRDDGSHFEQSLFYQRYAVEFFLCAAILADRNKCPFPNTYWVRLERMLEYLIYTSWPSGLHPSIGDSDGGRLIPFGPMNAEDHRPVLSTAAVYFHRGDFRRAAGTLHQQALWLLGPGAAAKFAALEQAEPSTASRTFLDAGAVTMRTGWGDNAKFLLFDAGPQGMRASGHGHADALSFVCAANGREWLVDPGTYVYSASRPWRDFFRSSAAHNTITIDGLDQAVPVDWFKWRKLPQVTLEQTFSHSFLDYAVGSHTGYARLKEPVFHRRHIVFVKPDYWIISDQLTGHGVHRARVCFHFAPGVSVHATEQGWLAENENDRFLLVPMGSGFKFRVARGEESPIQGWYSADYGGRRPASVLVGEGAISVPAQFHWLLCPVEGEVPRFQKLSAKGHLLSVKKGQKTDYLLRGGTGQEGSQCAFSTDAALAFVRRQDSGGIDKIVLLGGTHLWSEKAPILKGDRPFDLFVMKLDGRGIGIDACPAHPFRLQSLPLREVQVNGKAVSVSKGSETLLFLGEN